MTTPCVIIAGGRATRMGGGDKCRLMVAGAPIIAHILNRLPARATPVAINANGDPARFADLGLAVVPDDLPDHPGPLAGILAAMDWAAARGSDRVLTVAGDTPFFPTDLLDRLQAAAGTDGAAMAASPDDAGILRCHPVFALWPVRLREVLRGDVMAGQRRVAPWAEANGAKIVEFAPAPHDPFFNINSPDDLARAEEIERP